MAEELEAFADHEYEHKEIDGRMALCLRAGKDKRKKVEASRIPIVLDAITHGLDIYIENAVIDGDMNMEKIMNGWRPNRGYIGGRIDMQNSIIGGLFSFDRCVFQKEVYFYEIAFRKANFRNVEFQNKALFCFTTFEGVSFRNTTFCRAISFHDVTFGVADFCDTTFAEKAEFVGTSFDEEADFVRANFRKKAVFIRTVFDIADFREARLEEPEFRRVTFGREARFGNVKVKYPADFSNVEFEENTVIRGMCNDAVLPICWWIIHNLPPWSIISRMFERMMRKFLFSIKSTSQIDTKYILNELENFLEGKNLPIPTITSTQEKGNKCFINDIDNGKKYTAIRRRNRAYIYQEREHASRDLWKRIREYRKPVTIFSRFNTVTIMDGSSNPRFKRYIDDEQWIESWRTNPKGRRWREHVFRLWELTSHCGRSIGLWAAWSLLIAFAFGFLYAQYPFPSWLSWTRLEGPLTNIPHPELHITPKELVVAGEPIRETTWFTPYYFSVVTFTTLGFGDVTPLNLEGEIWLTVEVVLGYIMLGGLISIFANKFARRS